MRALFFGWALPASIAGGTAVLILMLATPLLLRFARPRLLRGLCGLALVLFWLPAGWLAPAPAAVAQPVVRRALPGPVAAAEQLTRQVTAPLAAKTPPAGAFDWQSPVILLWVVVLCVLLVLFAADWRIFRRQAARASVPADAARTGCLADAAAGLGISGRTLPRLVVCGRVGGPMLAGLLHPVILIPDTACPGCALRCALAHELCHWRAGDLPLKWAALLTAAVHWYNPTAWLLVFLLGRSCEYACDAAALAGAGEERFAYGAALLELHAARLPVSASGFSASGHRLKRRLMMILQSEKKTTPAHRVLAGLIALGILAAGLFAGCSAAGMSDESTSRSGALPITSSSTGAQPQADSSAGEQLEESQPDTAPDAQEPAVTPSPGETQAASEETTIPDSLCFPIGEGYTLWTRAFSGDHPAVDLAARYSTPIYAAADGIVLEATGPTDGLGIYIILDHGGWQTTYGHCAALAVKAGQQVEQGEVIGYVGATGNATGNFCHFILQENGVEIDPAPLLGLVSE